MASENVLPWILKHQKLIREPILEVGARHYKEHSSLHLRTKACAGLKDFTGCDLESGDNVDIVADLTADFDTLDLQLGSRRYRTIFCISVLEHIPDVFSAARNLSKLLAEDGILFLSVPFIFRFHGYPGDYWRFTPESVKFLFSGLSFDEKEMISTLSTLEEGDVMKMTEDFKKRNKFIFRPRGRWARRLRKEIKKYFGNRIRLPYSLAPTMVNMIGTPGTHDFSKQ